MPEGNLVASVEDLERRVDLLEKFPERVRALELQIVDLRSEMREQFSAVHQEFREEIRAATSDLPEIRTGDEETRRSMRVLREEVCYVSR